MHPAGARYGASPFLPAPGTDGRALSPEQALAALAALENDAYGAHPEHGSDVFRETPLRYFGYSNDFGEAFRSIIGHKWAARSYWLEGAYALADTFLEAKQAYRKAQGEPLHDRVQHVLDAVVEMGVFHAIASMTVPPMLIRAVQNRVVQSMPRRLARTALGKSLPVVTGLAMIPLISKPVDWATEKFLDRTIRPVLGRPLYFHDSHRHETDHVRNVAQANRKGPRFDGRPVRPSAFFDSTFG